MTSRTRSALRYCVIPVLLATLAGQIVYAGFGPSQGGSGGSGGGSWVGTATSDLNMGNYNITHVQTISPHNTSIEFGGDVDMGGYNLLNPGQVFVGSAGQFLTVGANSPEGSVSAPVASLYLRRGGGAGTVLYLKESGSGNTGWVAYGAGGSQTPWSSDIDGGGHALANANGIASTGTLTADGTTSLNGTVNLGDASSDTIITKGRHYFYDGGGATTPGIAFTSDTNTGIRRIGADDLAIVAGGVDALEVTAAGVVNLKAAGYSVAPLVLDAAHGIAPVSSTTFAGFSTRNGHSVLTYDVSINEAADWELTAPAPTLTITIRFMGATATTGDVVWGVSIERCATNDLDLDADSFDTEDLATATACNATSGKISTVSLTMTHVDSLAAGDLMRLRLRRATEQATDTMLGDAQVLAVLVGP